MHFDLCAVSFINLTCTFLDRKDVDGSSLDVYIMIIWRVWTHLSEDERRVEFKIDLSRANSSQWRRAAAERPVTGLLGCGIHGLPATHTRRQIRTGHPAVVPHMKVPAGQQRKTEEIMVSERLHKTMSNDIPIQQQSWTYFMKLFHENAQILTIQSPSWDDGLVPYSHQNTHLLSRTHPYHGQTGN